MGQVQASGFHYKYRTFAAAKSRGDRKQLLAHLFISVTIETPRLILREWEPRDLPLVAALNRDVHVSEFFPSPMTDQQSFDAVARYQAAQALDGFGFLAAEIRTTKEFIGIIGMQTMTLQVPGLSPPVVEIGWRIAHHHWGCGLATEGARAVIDYAFSSARLPRLAAVTSCLNIRSRRVMQKLGMRHAAELDFDHPLVPDGHPLQKHVVFMLESANH